MYGNRIAKIYLQLFALRFFAKLCTLFHILTKLNNKIFSVNYTGDYLLTKIFWRKLFMVQSLTIIDFSIILAQDISLVRNELVHNQYYEDVVDRSTIL